MTAGCLVREFSSKHGAETTAGDVELSLFVIDCQEKLTVNFLNDFASRGALPRTQCRHVKVNVKAPDRVTIVARCWHGNCIVLCNAARDAEFLRGIAPRSRVTSAAINV
jgi:hypothetical protein